MFASIVSTKRELPYLYLTLFILNLCPGIGCKEEDDKICITMSLYMVYHSIPPLDAFGKVSDWEKMHKEKKTTSCSLFSYHPFAKEDQGRFRCYLSSNKQLHGIGEAGEKILIKLQIFIVLTPKLILEVILINKCFTYSFIHFQMELQKVLQAYQRKCEKLLEMKQKNEKNANYLVVILLV